MVDDGEGLDELADVAEDAVVGPEVDASILVDVDVVIAFAVAELTVSVF